VREAPSDTLFNDRVGQIGCCTQALAGGARPARAVKRPRKRRGGHGTELPRNNLQRFSDCWLTEAPGPPISIRSAAPTPAIRACASTARPAAEYCFAFVAPSKMASTNAYRSENLSASSMDCLYRIVVRLTSALRSKNLNSGRPIALNTIQLMRATTIGPRLLIMRNSHGKRTGGCA
jgi:hypothetical protein